MKKENKEKRYEKPKVTRIRLDARTAVLGFCKNSPGTGPAEIAPVVAEVPPIVAEVAPVLTQLVAILAPVPRLRLLRERDAAHREQGRGLSNTGGT